MRQILISKAGKESVLIVRESPDPGRTQATGHGYEPAPAADRNSRFAPTVPIDVKAIGVNFADVLARKGMYTDAPAIPFVPGYEVSGVVSEDVVGPRSTDADPSILFHRGDRVCALTHFGGYATRVEPAATHVFRLPERMTFEEGAAFPVVSLTAYLAIRFFGNLKHGETVVVHSAGGGVGLAASQLAAAAGARVIGLASSAKHERLKSFGIREAIDSRMEDSTAAVRRLTGGRGADLILNSTGGRSARDSYRLLAPLGRLILFGISSASRGRSRNLPALISMALRMPRYGAISLMQDNRAVMGINLAHLWDESAILSDAMTELFAGYERGEIQPVISHVVEFDRAGDAHRILEERKNFGKVVIRV